MNQKRNHRMRRGISLLPGMLTVGNLLCGYYAILAAARGTSENFDRAAIAIGIAIVLDGLDGRVARMTRSSSAFGKELDSLADMVSFGIAPAFLALTWGLRNLDPASANSLDLVRHIYQLGWIVTFAFVIAGAWRLARFNLQPSDTGHPGHPGHRFFLGMPIPAAAGVIAAAVHYFKEPVTQWYWGTAWLALVASLAFLMISHLRYYSFKDIDLGQRRPSVVVVGIGLLVYSIVTYSEEVLLAIATVYYVSGLIALVRRRSLGHA